MLSTAASLGMLMLWDVETGLDKIDPYTNADEDMVKAGAMLATGIFNSGVRLDSDPAMALLGEEDNLSHKNMNIRVSAIMGLGLAYAGSNKEELLEMLLPIVTDTNLDMQLSAIAQRDERLMLFLDNLAVAVDESEIELRFDIRLDQESPSDSAVQGR